MPEKPNYQNVIEIFKKLEQDLTKELLAYLVLPNVVLTLAGERMLGDGVFWFKKEEDANFALKDLEKIKQVVTKSLDVISFSCSRFENPNIPGELGVEFTILYRPGLMHTLNLTTLVLQESKDNIRHIPSKHTKGAEEEVYGLMLKEVKKDSRWVKYSKDDLSTIVQGIELGYPDKAILSYIDNNYNHHDRERSFFIEGSANHPYEEVIDAEIKFSCYIWCPEPRYSYARSLINDKDIREHEKRWSKILEDFYTSDYFISLGKDTKFRKKLEQI